MIELTVAQKIAVWSLPLLFAITVHEFAHGWVAHKLGDNSAKMMGRLSLNPIKHIDLVGTIIIPSLLLFIGGFIFGWAKPVPVNQGALRNPKFGMAVVAIAGPLSNLIMAIFWSIIFALSHHSNLSNNSDIVGDIFLLLRLMGEAGVFINTMLMLFNLLPIPPLDGSRIASSFMPAHMAYQYNLLEKYGFIILLALLYLGLFQTYLAPWVRTVGIAILKIFW